MIEEGATILDLEQFKEVHAWSHHRQADYHRTKEFIVTSTHRLILKHLRDSKGGIIVCIGPTGSGKTATRDWLALWLGRGQVISLVWKNADQIESLVATFRKKTRTKEKEVEKTREVPLTGEEAVSRYELNKTKTERYTETEYEKEVYYGDDPSYIFIEFKDYSMTHRTAANKDLDDLQVFIGIQSHPPMGSHSLERNPYGVDLQSNICLFYQGEQWATLKHHWLNKPQVFRLTPIESDQFVEMYHKLWGRPHLFTEAALFELAEMSRGNPRWFMKYIDRCCDSQLEKEDSGGTIETLTLDDIHDIIKAEDMVREWEIEFKALFPDSEVDRVLAELIVRDLVKDGPTMQPVFRKKFFDPGKKGAQRCSYVLGKMEESGYIKRTIMSLPGNPKRVELVERR